MSLIAMIAELGAVVGATLTLDASTLREFYEEHRKPVAKKPQGWRPSLSARPRSRTYGSVRVSKRQLAERMAQRIIDDINARDADRVGADRPIVAILLAISASPEQGGSFAVREPIAPALAREAALLVCVPWERDGPRLALSPLHPLLPRPLGGRSVLAGALDPRLDRWVRVGVDEVQGVQ